MNTTIVNLQQKRIIAIGCSTGAAQPLVIVAPSIVDTWRQAADYHSAFVAGQRAFHQGAVPDDDWPQPMVNGWQWAGEGAYLDACQSEDVGISETFSPWR